MLLMTNKVYETRSTGFVYDVLVSAKEIPPEYVHYFTDKKKIPDSVTCIKTNSIVLADIAHEIEINEDKKTALEVLEKMISYVELEPSGVIINVSKISNGKNNIKSQAYLNYCEWFVNNELSLCEKGKEFSLANLEASIYPFENAKLSSDNKNKLVYGNLNWVDEIWSFSSNLITRTNSNFIKDIYITYDNVILTDIMDHARFEWKYNNILHVFMMTVSLLTQVGNLSKKDKFNVYLEKGLVFRNLLKYLTMSQRFHKVGLINDYDVLEDTMKVCMKLINHDDNKHNRKIEYSIRTLYDIDKDTGRSPMFQLELDDNLSNTGSLLDNTFKNDLLSVNITSNCIAFFKIYEKAFDHCKNLTYFDYDKKLKIGYIDFRAFYKTGLKRIKLKCGLAGISNYALACTDIEQIKLPQLPPDSPDVLGRGIFNRNSKITTIKCNTHELIDLFNHSLHYNDDCYEPQHSNIALDITLDKLGAFHYNYSSIKYAIKGRFIKRFVIHDFDYLTSTFLNPANNGWLTDCNIWNMHLYSKAVAKLFNAYHSYSCKDDIERLLRRAIGNSEVHTFSIVINSYVKSLADNDNELNEFEEYLESLLNNSFKSRTVFVNGL